MGSDRKSLLILLSLSDSSAALQVKYLTYPKNPSISISKGQNWWKNLKKQCRKWEFNLSL